MRLNRNLLIFIILIVLTFIPHSKVKAKWKPYQLVKPMLSTGQAVTVSVSKCQAHGIYMFQEQQV